MFGEMIQFDEHIFQMGWFNHQLAIVRIVRVRKSGKRSKACFFFFGGGGYVGELVHIANIRSIFRPTSK